MTTPQYKRTKSLEERIERRKANQRRYRETHQDQIKAYQQRTLPAQRARTEKFLLKNRELQKIYYREYNVKNRERKRARILLKLYGITLEQWNDLFISQGSRCAICKSDAPWGRVGWTTDHCHKTKKVRGILCNICNVMLGHAKDDVSILKEAIEYLTSPPYQT